MRVKFRIIGKVNFIDIKTSRQLTCLYVRSLIFLFTFGLKYAEKTKFTTHALAKF